MSSRKNPDPDPVICQGTNSEGARCRCHAILDEAQPFAGKYCVWWINEGHVLKADEKKRVAELAKLAARGAEEWSNAAAARANAGDVVEKK
jgi:hypothetical protein